MVSTAQTPDLGWSQIRETVLMLELAATQINTAMKDSHASVNTLSTTFTSMADHLNRINEALGALSETGETGDIKHAIAAEANQVTSMMGQAIIAFQFYDRLVQRMDHVCHSLSQLGGLVDDRSRLYNPDAWVDLQSAIRSKYTTPEEHAMFQAVLNGVPVEQAVEQFMAEKQSQGSDIELF